MGGKAFADREVGLKWRQRRDEHAAREMIEADDSGSWLIEPMSRSRPIISAFGRPDDCAAVDRNSRDGTGLSH
jgi:hypothetical protein